MSPHKATTQKLYANLDFQRALQAYLNIGGILIGHLLHMTNVEFEPFWTQGSGTSAHRSRIFSGLCTYKTTSPKSPYAWSESNALLLHFLE